MLTWLKNLFQREPQPPVRWWPGRETGRPFAVGRMHRNADGTARWENAQPGSYVLWQDHQGNPVAFPVSGDGEEFTIMGLPWES